MDMASGRFREGDFGAQLRTFSWCGICPPGSGPVHVVGSFAVRVMFSGSGQVVLGRN